jgi:hypothetical protein
LDVRVAFGDFADGVAMELHAGVDEGVFQSQSNTGLHSHEHTSELNYKAVVTVLLRVVGGNCRKRLRQLTADFVL